MGIVVAWGVGLSIVGYRWVKAGAPPTPGVLAGASGFFALLALLHTYPPARTTATLMAVGVDVAALLQVLPGSKNVTDTGWPPPLIDDPGVILPPGAGTAAAAGGGKTPAGKKWNIWTGNF